MYLSLTKDPLKQCFPMQSFKHNIYTSMSLLSAATNGNVHTFMSLYESEICDKMTSNETHPRECSWLAICHLNQSSWLGPDWFPFLHVSVQPKSCSHCMKSNVFWAEQSVNKLRNCHTFSRGRLLRKTQRGKQDRKLLIINLNRPLLMGIYRVKLSERKGEVQVMLLWYCVLAN